MNARHVVLSVVIAVVTRGCAPLLPPPTATLARLPTVAVPPSPTPTATSAPTATPLPTAPAPTPAPIAPTVDATQVVATIEAGQSALSAQQVEALCLRREDADGDGVPEWIGITSRRSEPPRLAAFVVGNDGTWHDLAPHETSKYGLGVYPTCELSVRDINADGRPEVLVWGHAETSTTLLHVFVWDAGRYALLAAFEGPAGVRLENSDGDLADEIVVGYPKGADLVWEAVHTWDGSSYGWTWDRHRWRALDRPHAYSAATPEVAVISFYLALNDRDLPGAYRMLSASAQARSPYPEWALGYATTLRVEAGSVHEAGRSGESSAVVATLVRSYDNAEGRVLGRLWDVEWTLTREGELWRLDSVTADLLDQWEAVYYP